MDDNTNDTDDGAYIRPDHDQTPPYLTIAVLMAFNVYGGSWIVKCISDICG